MLKFVRTKLLKWYTVVPLSIALLVSSCYSDNESVSPKEYSGEELFRGIFFLQGDVADHLETLKLNTNSIRKTLKQNPNAEKEHMAFVDEIVNQVKNIDPGYFDQFKSQMQSQNFYGIELALTNGMKMIKVAGHRSSYASIFQLADKINEKKVDFSSKEFKELDLSKDEDKAKFKSILKDTYAIDMDDEDYKVACVPAFAFCVGLAVFVTVAVAIHNTVALYVFYAGGFAVTEFWSGDASVKGIGLKDALVSEIASVF